MEDKINFLLNIKYSEISDIELKSHIFNHICVLESGYLEKELQSIVDNYKTSKHFRTHVCKDAINSARNIQNAKWCSVRPIFANIDECILKKLHEIKDFTNITDSIDAIVKTRHKVAHGEDVSGLDEKVLGRHFENLKIFVEKLKEIFKDLETR